MKKYPLEEAMEKAVTAGWAQFVARRTAERERSNARLFRLLTAIRGEAFVSLLVGLMHHAKADDSRLRVYRQPKGVEVNTAFGPLWIDYRFGAPSLATIYIQVKADRWIGFTHQ
ncbi:hypothetical protein [Spirosoma sordidisoli]|uniref:Uncharacterized protein n=1 Tax=Spirosoma sordidisoli TaxID=2502893 RepID=A0A4Q2UC15_9BACT|nr:hypothetical protein [Spirosoma sordidisoli]RYC66334.1 hypothetical protein EQG79_30125 [Spirosoma sordidisoli]